MSIRAGFIGLSGFAATRRKWVRKSGMFEIAGGFDISREACELAAREEGAGFSVARSVEELVARDDLEIIFVCTPPQLHLEHAFAAARAGKHLFVEKPIGVDLAESGRLVSFCREKRLLLGVGFSVRHQPGAIACKQFIDAGKLGKVVAADVVTMSSTGLIFPKDNWRFRADRNPGGVLINTGIHELDLLRWWLGDGKVVAAMQRNDITDKATADSFTMLMRFGEIPVTMQNHYVTAYQHYAQIFGTEGNLYYSIAPEELWWQPQRGGAEEPREKIALPAHRGEQDAMAKLADALRDGTPFEPSGEDGVASLEMIFDAVALAEK